MGKVRPLDLPSATACAFRPASVTLGVLPLVTLSQHDLLLFVVYPL